ncbi:ATPase [Methanobacterium petrolearium]|uniref:ATPase n=1 Tax=Methanobacterium petrolearium TaxID=710190 RepID=UPI001AE23B3B|nr:ATPase [Methanobacterium petrolearium]MBP1945712.1 hypothetical protein [Methanobacterium petrolearium]BDZ71961.1 hypothetical protein GCM10025861_24780 [Methanobacterium petrolearium]
MTVKRDVVKFLQQNGVETRFVSIVDERVYINNLKLSRFSRKKEELFLREYPNFRVRRSKIFQKICTRASRVLKDALSPHDKILLFDSGDCVNLTLHTVLEPYTRKYGVELIIREQEGNLDDWISSLQLHGEQICPDSVALPLTLDGEVEHILELMLDGEKLELLSSQTTKDEMKLIYPLINVPTAWIESWIKLEGLECCFEYNDAISRKMLEFLEGFIPDVREKMMRSASYLSWEK